MNLIIILACLFITTSANNNTTKDATEVTTITTTIEPRTNHTKEILEPSETADPAKVEIVKQIRRLNEDGSYTIGYEADDGTFKIESRDVLGNVKGTFGYIDKDGEIKRVTYSSSSDSTPVPVTTSSTTPSTPAMIVRMNKTVSSSASTTRRPALATVVYPTRGTSYTTRGTVIQNIPRRRPIIPGRGSVDADMTTENQKPEETTNNILNLYKPKAEDIMIKRSQMLRPVTSTLKNDLITKQSTHSDSTTKRPQTLKPVYEQVDEKPPDTKSNTIRRELTGTSPNPHMVHLQQSVGDDSTDVYGGHLSMGTVRPLFTTTTPRPRLIPLQSLVAARQKIQQQYQHLGQDEQETTIEASTGRVFDQENVVTTNPVPVVHIQPHRDQHDERIFHQPIYRRPSTAVHFRTGEYLRDNPGAAVPIGNQRPFLGYEFQDKVLEPPYVKDHQQQAKGTEPEVATVQPTQAYEVRPVTRIIPIPVDERGVPIPGYQARFVNPYRQPTQQPPPPVFQLQPRLIEPVFDEMNSISTPVSTRDLKRLLQVLILRQNRLQALMDQIVAPSPQYQPLPLLRQHQQYEYNQRPAARYQQIAPRYQEDDRYDYRYEQDRQQDAYYNQMYEPQYESQRYVPRRRLYTRPVYDSSGSSTNHIDESPEYLPAEVREALLLKMLMLAISPDFMPSSPPAPQQTEMTTAAPTRKQVRNVQILGEEGAMDVVKMPAHRH